MTFQRLLDDPEDDFENALLRSAMIDVPSDADVRRGVLSIAAVGGSLSASSVAASMATASTHVPAHSAGFAAVILKWLGIGFAAGMVTSGGSVLALQHFSVRATASPRVESVTSSESRLSAPLTKAPEIGREEALDVPAPPPENAAPTPHTIPEPPAHTGSGHARYRAEGPPPLVPVPEPPSAQAVQAPPTMTAEIAMLSSARLALSARDPERVLRGMDEYDRMPRTHVLDTEATMLRIEALVQAGRVTEAAERARTYLSLYPGSPHRSRLQQIAEE